MLKISHNCELGSPFFYAFGSRKHSETICCRHTAKSHHNKKSQISYYNCESSVLSRFMKRFQVQLICLTCSCVFEALNCWYFMTNFRNMTLSWNYHFSSEPWHTVLRVDKFTEFMWQYLQWSMTCGLCVIGNWFLFHFWKHDWYDEVVACVRRHIDVTCEPHSHSSHCILA